MAVRGSATCSLGSLIGQVVFGWYKSVEIAQAPGACAGCYIYTDLGFRPACYADCELMWDFKPAIVASIILKKLKNPLENNAELASQVLQRTSLDSICENGRAVPK